MQKHCTNCNKLFNKKINTSIRFWEKSKYCSKDCKRTGESKRISERVTQQNKSRIGVMRFNGISYTKEWCGQNPEEVQRFKNERKLNQKRIRTERTRLETEQRKLLNPKILKSVEEKKLWQKEYRHRRSVELKKYYQTDDSKYKQYQSSARKRNHIFELTFEQFTQIFHSNCKYCGTVDCRGVDRIDNSIGYTYTNSASCCKICNKMKIDYSDECFIEHCKKVSSNN